MQCIIVKKIRYNKQTPDNNIRNISFWIILRLNSPHMISQSYVIVFITFDVIKNYIITNECYIIITTKENIEKIQIIIIAHYITLDKN